jgi:type IV secretory pathway TraG/TraD family ATPase VirD4
MNARDRLPADTHPAELIAVAGLVLAVAAAGMGWLIVEAAAALAGHHPPLTLAAAGRGLLGWPGHLSDPRRAFPAPTRRELPGAVRMYLALVLVLAGIAAGGFAGLRMWRRLSRSTHRGYASPAQVRWALSRDAARRRGPTDRASSGRAVVELGVDGRTGQRLFGAAEDSYLYLGPPRSGKSVHLIIPQTINAPGPALVTETRPDVLRHTISLRVRRGPVAVFDPQYLANENLPRLRWAPQHGCADPLIAIARARGLAAGAQLGGGSVTDAAFWQGMTEAVLRCYLHAAALDARTMRDVLTWAMRPTDPTPVRILRRHADAAPGWAEELLAQAGADPRQRDSVWASVRRSVDCLADPRVLDTCSPAEGDAFDPAGFLRAGGTLYLLGTTGTQLTVAPLVSGLVEALIDTARTLGAQSPTGRLDPPLTVLLDEAANIAPIPSLPNLLADGGGSGITTICVLQSMAQARARWSQAGADAIWDASTTKLILGGLAHAEDLQRISQLAGEIDEPVHTRTHGSGGTSTSVGPRRLSALPVERLRTLPDGTAIVLARRTPPVEARLQPWWDGPHASTIRAALTSTHTSGHEGERA